jgi:uncharacterized protein (DUF433 family)
MNSLRKRKRRRYLRWRHGRVQHALVRAAIQGLTDVQEGLVHAELDSVLSSRQSHGFAEISPPEFDWKRMREIIEAQAHPPRVVSDPDVMLGIPCLSGSRLPARTLLAMVDAGHAWERIVESWPWLTPQHVEAARAWLARQDL